MRLTSFTLLTGIFLGLVAHARQATPAIDPAFQSRFAVDKADLASTGRNPYFILEPGYTLTLEDGSERLTITVLAETRPVDGVETRVVEERQTDDGRLVEVSRNFFAIHRKTNDVFYFGEDVDIYKGGKIVSHDGAWLSGLNGARFGLMMPGLPKLQAKYYQEIAPDVAMDRAVIVSLTETLRVPAGTFTEVLKTEETTPLEPNAREFKYYARGVGLLQDGSLKLVKVKGDGGRSVENSPDPVTLCWAAKSPEFSTGRPPSPWTTYLPQARQLLLFLAPMPSSSLIVSGKGCVRCSGLLAMSTVVWPARLTTMTLASWLTR